MDEKFCKKVVKVNYYKNEKYIQKRQVPILLDSSDIKLLYQTVMQISKNSQFLNISPYRLE